MNDWQMIRQVQYLTRLATWSGSANVLFSSESVIATARVAEDTVAAMRLPLAVISYDGEDIDPTMQERPDAVEMRFKVTLVVTNQGDQYGESSLMGRNRSATTSPGRGLLEMKEQLRTTLLQLGPASGLPIVYRSGSAPAPIQHPTVDYLVGIGLAFSADGTTFRTYQAPFGLTPTANGSGSVTLAWSAMPRFDFLTFVLRRASGTTPPATIASGTGVTLASAGAVTVTQTGVTPGVYSYSLFAQYDDVGAGTATGTSPAQTCVVTVT